MQFNSHFIIFRSIYSRIKKLSQRHRRFTNQESRNKMTRRTKRDTGVKIAFSYSKWLNCLNRRYIRLNRFRRIYLDFEESKSTFAALCICTQLHIRTHTQNEQEISIYKILSRFGDFLLHFYDTSESVGLYHLFLIFLLRTITLKFSFFWANWAIVAYVRWTWKAGAMPMPPAHKLRLARNFFVRTGFRLFGWISRFKYGKMVFYSIAAYRIKNWVKFNVRTVYTNTYEYVTTYMRTWDKNVPCQ